MNISVLNMLFNANTCHCNLAADEQLDVSCISQYDGDTVFIASDSECSSFYS